MQAIKVLGAQGSSGLKEDCVSFQINEQTLIDAGNVISELGESINEIDNIFISHAHFDHIRDLPFIIESYYQNRNKPLNVYASEKTIKAIKQHLFNNTIWPEFHKINHPTLKVPALIFNEIEAGQTIKLGEKQLYSYTAFSTQHCEGSLGFVVEHNSQAFILCSDTYLSDELTQIIQNKPNANSLFIETSFPNELEELALTSQHLTPTLLAKQLEKITRPLKVFIYHLKPLYKQQIKEQVCKLLSDHEYIEICGFLDKGQEITVFEQHPKTKHLSQAEVDITQNIGADKLASILKISEAFSGEFQLNQLLDLVIDEAISFTQANAATLYRFNKDLQTLDFTVVRNKQLNIKLGGSHGVIDWPALPLYQNNKPNNKMVAALCALQKKPLLIDDVYDNKEFDFSGTKAFDQKTGYLSKSMLVVPLLGRENELLGVIQLINKTNHDSNPSSFTIEDKQGTLALASQAAMSISNAILINQMEELFDAFAKAINVAFDKKCFFTGMHINQVAELAQLISHAIHKDTEQYADISYTPQMLHTIKVAALVHDVGKIATPESILHKATKLQANIDRIDLIEQRFMLYKQNLIIDELLNLTSSNQQPLNPILEALSDEFLKLEKDFTFIQKMNTGKEFLTDEDATIIKDIASTHYKFNEQRSPLINSDELQHLLIQRGTLTELERQQIQEHAHLSLEMLQTLPFPKQYGKIVDIAANHHEKLNGTGYPRGLDASQLTLEDEILVLADIYEALSSPHRPYKKPMDLTQVVNILCSMANNGEIDANLVKFFFESGIYKSYNHHLNPEQITEFTLNIDEQKSMSIHP